MAAFSKAVQGVFAPDWMGTLGRGGVESARSRSFTSHAPRMQAFAGPQSAPFRMTRSPFEERRGVLLLSGPLGHGYGEEEDAAEAGFAVLVAVPLGDGVGAAAIAACAHGERRDAESDRDVGVG